MERSEKVFKEFIDLCREVTSNDTVVLELLQKRYNRTNLHFLWSNDFPDLIERCRKKIEEDRDNKYVYIKEFTTELKAYKAKPLKHLRETRGSVAKAEGGGGGQVRKADACPELEPPAKRTRLTNDSCSASHKAKERLETTPTTPFATQVTRQIRTQSCTLIPLSLMCNSQTGNKKDLVAAGETSTEDERRRETDSRKGGGMRSASLVTSIHINDIENLRLPQLQIVLDKRDDLTALSQILSQSQSSRQNLVESLSDDEADNNASTADPSDGPSQLVPQEEEGGEMRDDRVQMHIDRLEKLLKKISKEIKRLQETELSFEDMDKEDSSYTLEDRFKKRFVKVWNRLCELKGRDTSTGREVERKLNYCGTNYPQVNKSISRFVNKFHVFPDYSDIHEIIVRSNRKHDLGIRKSAIDRLAREAFTEVGNILQKRRMADYVDNFGCHLTENVKSRDDPALFDSRLRQQLEENSKVSKTNLDEILSKYAQKQDEDPEDAEEEEDEDDEEEEEEEEGEDEKKFMEQMEEIVVTDGSNTEQDDEDEEEEELNKENGSKENKASGGGAGSCGADLTSEGKNNRDDDGANIDLSTDKSTSESLSLLDDILDEPDDLPLTSETQAIAHSSHKQRNFLESLTTKEEEPPTVSLLENNKDKATEVESVCEERRRVIRLEDESMDVSIIDPIPLSSSSSADLQLIPSPSRTTELSSCLSSSSSDVIVCGKASAVDDVGSPLPSLPPPLPPSSGSTSDEVKRVNALVSFVSPIDVICLDEEQFASPAKNGIHSMKGCNSTEANDDNDDDDDVGNRAMMTIMKRTEKPPSSLALGLLRLKQPSEKVMRCLATVDVMNHRKALSLRQPTMNPPRPPPSESTLTTDSSSDEDDDVIEIRSIPAPINGRRNYGSTAIRQEMRSSVNTTQTTTSSVARRDNSTDECCIVTTVEEHVVSTVMTSRGERSGGGGVRGHQVEVRQQMKKTMRVVGQVVRFNADQRGGQQSRPKQQQNNQQQQHQTRPANSVMHGSRRIAEMNQQQAKHCHDRSTVTNCPSGTSSQPFSRSGPKNRLNVATKIPTPSLNKQLDDISSQIVSSIFKNQPKRSESSSDADVIICDDVVASPLSDVISPTTAINNASKLTKQMVSRVNRGGANGRRSIGQHHQVGTRGERVAQGSRSRPALRSSQQDNENGPRPHPPKSSHPSRTLPQLLPDVIELV